MKALPVMIKFFTLFAIIVVCGAENNSTAEGNRQKRAMLFFDEGGNLLKKFASPYLQELAQYAARKPEHENFLKYFFNFLRPLIINTSTAAYMIPVSEDVVQQINRDPVYQNRLTISRRGPDYNPLCAGRRTQIPSPSTCNSFLSCWDGWAYELECPEGLMFSSEGYCDYADMVQCKDRAALIPDPQMPYCKQDFETFRNELNCNEFFVCVNRKPVKFKCPADLVYSLRFGVCDYSNMVDCSSSVNIAEIPSSPAAPAPLLPPIPQLPLLPQSPTPPPPPAPTTTAPIPEQPASTTKAPTIILRPVPPGQLINLPSTFPASISSQINRFPDFPDNPTGQHNLVPGVQQLESSQEEIKPPEFQFKPNVADGNAIFMQNSIYNNQNWATPVAIMSPQDAVRFLKLKNFADTKYTQPQF